MPGRADVSTFLYYSSGKIRKEFFYYGEPVIQILDANRKLSLMCFTEQQICYENNTLENIPLGVENSMKTPCDDNEALSCENLGEEDIQKRKTTHWQLSVMQGDEKLLAQVWLDKELNIPIKQILFNGTRIELTWLGEEKLNNRDTDKWVQRIELANGQVRESYQWYDKELKITIRETFPNGNSQELQHIVVQQFDDKLFSIPPGYEKKTMTGAATVSK